ncbi:MAG: alpha/beta fold hydrolase [Acidobacteria bacterium]|nr:alpha/beta fold hydrolase [Acidobacteriota bacterium]
MATEEFRDDSVPDGSIRGFVHRAGRTDAPGLVLTHGAGANCRSALLTALADAFCTAGVTVLRCDLPFRQARPYGPPPRGSAQRDQAGLQSAVEALKRQTSGRIFLGGHSYGGRQASILAAQDPQIARALLLLSYPLHPPDKPEMLRTDHFPSLRTPALFLSGDKDGFGTREELDTALRLIPSRTKLTLLAGVGHELMSKKNAGELPNQVVKAFLDFASD